MTLDQLRIFVAVAEREHLTDGARSVHLSPSAATAAIQALEDRYRAKLFHRVGRRLELSDVGRAFLAEARAVLNAATTAEVALQELSGLRRGRLKLAASQTLASHWLPPVLMRFAAANEGVAVSLIEGNTTSVAEAVKAGDVEMGCIEGEIDEPALAVTPLAEDRLVIVSAPNHHLVGTRPVPAASLGRCSWVMREPGSGTRAVFEAAMAGAGVRSDGLIVTMTLPTNEAVCAAAAESDSVTAVSELVARPYLQAGRLRRIDYSLPPRRFALVRHKERFRTAAALAFEALVREEGQRLSVQQSDPDYEI